MTLSDKSRPAFLDQPESRRLEFEDLRLIEAWCSGIQKMRQGLKDYPEIDLVLQESGHAFQVQFIKEMTRAESGPSRNQAGTKSKAESGQSQGRVRAESLKEGILSALVSEPLSEAEISAKMGFKGVPGHIAGDSFQIDSREALR